MKSNTPGYLLPGISAIIVLLIVLLGMQLYYQKKMKVHVARLNNEGSMRPARDKIQKGKLTPQHLEGRINDLTAELHKLTKENENLDRVIKEYNGIQHEYDSLKHGLHKAYKIRNYPGYDKTKHETNAMQTVLDTENIVATYAYEKFLKPILSLTDTNKNNPAMLTENDRKKLLDHLLSLSLLYIEYLYLRINDLSIGGKMVERIKGFSSGNGIDTTLLKKMNTDHGSRALVVKMALAKAGVSTLSYPVFDETDLNNQ
jgi:cell division protein FtsB